MNTSSLDPSGQGNQPGVRSPRVPRSAREFPWTKEEDSLLGKLFDHDVAEKLDRTIYAVRGRRKFLGIPAVVGPPQPLRYKREHDALFATKSEKELRSLFGWSYRRIRNFRRWLAGGKKPRRRMWSNEEDQLLGTKPDHVLAREFGRTTKAVKGRRETKRIRLTETWKPEDDKILGLRTDEQTAALLGCSPSNVGWRRHKLGIPAKAALKLWTPEEEQSLGKRPDDELARLFGRTTEAVEAHRIELGIPKLDARYCLWTPEEDALLGKLTDDEVARRLNYSLARVRRRRRFLGLQNPNPKHRHWTAEDVAWDPLESTCRHASLSIL